MNRQRALTPPARLAPQQPKAPAPVLAPAADRPAGLPARITIHSIDEWDSGFHQAPAGALELDCRCYYDPAGGQD